jgi:hypothetical protein
MRHDFAFRLLHHLTLALAGACLAYAERAFLPELAFALPPFLVLLSVAFLLDGRWSLPAWGANVLGVVIAAGAGWLVLRSYGQAGSWLPHVGPVLLALLLVKLFRPRARGDFWLLQGVGLLLVGLGCVLTTGPVFGALLLAYLSAALCCLAAHHRHAERLAAPGAAPGGRFGWAGFALRWVPAVAALALPLFLLTPRGDAPPWEPLQRLGGRGPRPTVAQTGFTAEIDLNRTGALRVDQRVAFTVRAADEQGRPQVDLPADQRWRGAVLDSYRDGLWTGLLQPPGGPRLAAAELTAPGTRVLTFTVLTDRAGGLFLADPVRLGPRPGELPVQALPGPGDLPALFGEVAGTPLPALRGQAAEYRYRQVVPPGQDRDRYPAERVPAHYLEDLIHARHNGPQRAVLRAWTNALLRRLAAQPRYRRHRLELPPAAEGADAGPVLWETQWQAGAQLLADHLAHSGEYAYSLDLRRGGPELDPVLDFLQNVKQGHCERYAAALALMLRAQGVPARVVKGFRGAEHQGGGQYVVRHSHAHSWVEAAVPRPGGPRNAFDWLVLDPTPETDAPPASFSLARWWGDQRSRGQDLWRHLIVGYGPSQQADLWQGLASGRLAWRAFAVAALAATALLGLALRRRWRRRRAAPAPAGFHRRLLALLARHLRLRPRPGQTPRELAVAAGAALAARPATAALADLPGQVVELFYRVRFGGRPLGEAEGREIEARLDALARALRHPS